jgi:hypothetical protein
VKDNGLLILLLGIGGLVWYASSQSATSAPASTAGAGTAGSAPPPGAASTATAPQTAAAASAATPAAASYSGPSLAQMYSALVAAVIAGYQGGDTAVTCSGSMSGLGIPRPTTLAPAATVVIPRPVAPTAGGTPVTAATRVGSNRSGCINPQASPDVWNWYLSQRANVGVSNPPSSAAMGLDENTPIDGPTYWAAASPLLQAAMPGLSGLRGLTLRRPKMPQAKTPRSYYYGGWTA